MSGDCRYQSKGGAGKQVGVNDMAAASRGEKSRPLFAVHPHSSGGEGGPLPPNLPGGPRSPSFRPKPPRPRSFISLSCLF